MRRALFADVDSLGVRRGKDEQGVGREVIVEDDIGKGEDAPAFERQEVRVAGPRPNQVNLGCRGPGAGARGSGGAGHALYTASRMRRAPRSNSSAPRASP